MANTLEMTFRNHVGKEIVISLANPKDNITAAEVNTAMQTIIAKNVFTSTGGDLKDIVSAQIRQVNVTSLT